MSPQIFCHCVVSALVGKVQRAFTGIGARADIETSVGRGLPATVSDPGGVTEVSCSLFEAIFGDFRKPALTVLGASCFFASLIPGGNTNEQSSC